MRTLPTPHARHLLRGLARRTPPLLIAPLMMGTFACVSISARPGARPDRVTTRGTVPNGRLPGTGDGAQTTDHDGRPAVTMAKRRVASKEPPATLVASDGLRCTVSRDRYEQVRVGDDVSCVWIVPSDGSQQSGTR